MTAAVQYFFCLGRHQRRTDCTLPYLAAEAVEMAVESYYRTMRLPEVTQEQVRTGLGAELNHPAAPGRAGDLLMPGPVSQSWTPNDAGWRTAW